MKALQHLLNSSTKWLLPVFSLLSITAFSQQNMTLYGLSDAPQALYLNPAFKQNNRLFVNVGVGFQNFAVTNTGFRLHDTYETSPNNDSVYINPSQAVSKMAKINYLQFQTSNEILAFGLKLKKGFVSFNVTSRSQVRFTYPRDLFKFVLDGNGNEFLGQRISMDGLRFDALSYMEYAVGYNRTFGDKLTLGAKVKFLSGIADVRTKQSRLGLTTDSETFDITVDGSMKVNTSNVSPYYKNKDSVGKFNPAAAMYNFQNFGLGIDAGASYQANDRLRLDASILDFGFITWKSHVTNYESNDVNFKFKGIDFNQRNFDSLQLGKKLIDSLKTNFGHKENTEKYTTGLYTRFLIGGSLTLTKIISVSAVLNNQVAASKLSSALTLSATAMAGKWFRGTVSYSMYGRSYGNVGVGLILKPGPVQFMFMSDNIFAFINPTNAKYAQFAFGVNTIIGAKKDKKQKIKKD